MAGGNVKWDSHSGRESGAFLENKMSTLQASNAGKEPPAMWEAWVGKIPWRRERLPTPVFWPGEFHGLYSPWGHEESDTTERLSLYSL